MKDLNQLNKIYNAILFFNGILIFLVLALFLLITTSCEKQADEPQPGPDPGKKLVSVFVDIRDIAGQQIFVDCFGVVDTISEDWHKDILVGKGEFAGVKVYSHYRNYANAKMEIAGKTVRQAESDDLYDEPINLTYSW